MKVLGLGRQDRQVVFEAPHCLQGLVQYTDTVTPEATDATGIVL